MLSGATPCHLLDELLTEFPQNQILLSGLIDKKEAANCQQLLMLYFCYPLSSFLTIFKMLRLMGEMSIKHSEKRFGSYSSDLPVSKHVAISWTPDSVICMWCFNGNINYPQYFWSCILLYH